jgi:hypothetical protein
LVQVQLLLDRAELLQFLVLPEPVAVRLEAAAQAVLLVLEARVPSAGPVAAPFRLLRVRRLLPQTVDRGNRVLPAADR